MWTEPDGTDFALSFQDMEGCSEIWDFVVEVQRHFRGKGNSHCAFNQATVKLLFDMQMIDLPLYFL